MNKQSVGIPFQWTALITATREQQAQPAAGLAAVTVDDTEPATLTLERIIADKPSTKIVRQFFKENLASIKSEEQQLFENH